MKRPLSLWTFCCAIALGGLVTTGMWAAFEQVGALAVGAVLFHLCLAFIFLKLAGWPLVDWPGGKIWMGWSRRLVSTVLLVPLLYILARTWNFDFPLSGDHDHHLLSAVSAVEFWSHSWWDLIGFSVLIWAAIQFRFNVLGTLGAFAVIMLASHWAEPLPTYFFRYPASTYLLDVPMVRLAHVLDLNSIWGACRVINFLAPVVWLLVLRPYFFGANSGGWILAAFLLLQRDDLITFDSVYLESWSVVWLLMALESLLDEATPAWWSALFAGIACIFKDTAAIPFLIVGLAAMARSWKQPREFFSVLGVGSLSILPFTVYYLARRQSGVWRTIDLSSWHEGLTELRLDQLWFRLQYQYHAVGFSMLAIAIGFSLYSLSRSRSLRGPALVLFFGGCAEFALFFVDKISLPYVGLPRLLLMPWILILAPALLLKGRRAYLLALLLGLSQVPALAEYIFSLEQPAYAQNFSEDYNVPYHYPIRQLMDKGRPLLKPRQTVVWIVSNPVTKPMIFPETYRDLMKLYDWRVFTPQQVDGHCQCLPGVAFLIMTTPARNIRALSPLALSTELTSQISEACLAQFEKTCRCFREGDPVEGRLCLSP